MSEALRQVTAGTGEQISRTQADTILRRERRRIAQTATVHEAAARILALSSLELSALERETGPRDLDRLHKLAQILGTVERLRPQKDEKKEQGLMQLAEEGRDEQQAAA